MATPTSTVTEYCAALAKSKLVREDEIGGIRADWEKETRGADADVEWFRKFLVKKQYLTDYQAALIQRGRSEGFYIGGYVILDRIGSGQTAGVYKAVHTSGQVVALKVLPSSKSKEQHALNRFQREGRLLTQLDHPNVVRAFQLGQAGGANFIVMEHLDGETLDEMLARRKKLPAPEAVRVVYQALLGLQHLADKRMVHRDLKPANLMVAPTPGMPASKTDTTLDATIKILDIGLGRETFDEDSPATQDLQLTGEGALLGTPDYLAPEQARDARSADVRADIYSLGCVLFHLIAGRPPFQDRNVMAQMVKHATEKPPGLADLIPGTSPKLAAAVAKLLEKKPENRPQTPSEAAEVLAPFLPERATNAAKVPVLPAYQQWLESESAFELPNDARAAMQAATKAHAPVAVPLPVPAILAGPSSKPARPKSPTEVKPVAASRSEAIPAGKPKSLPHPALAVATPPPPLHDEINVELVTLPAPVEPEEPRSTLELNRRDFALLGIGSLGVLLAIGAGYGLSRAVRRKVPDDDPATEPTGK